MELKQCANMQMCRYANVQICKCDNVLIKEFNENYQPYLKLDFYDAIRFN